MRTTPFLAIGLAVALTAAGCSPSSTVTAESELITLGQSDIPLADFTYHFETTADLIDQAPIIVVARHEPGTAAEKTSLVSPEDQATLTKEQLRDAPRAFSIEMTVVEVLAGDVKKGDVITVVSQFDFPGQPGKPMLAANSDFLLFMGPRTYEEGDNLEEYGVLGWYEGYFQRTAGDSFNRLDPATSKIPTKVTLSDIRDEVAQRRKDTP